jgi:diguanylate cyclase (GGDEF)-like protein
MKPVKKTALSPSHTPTTTLKTLLKKTGVKARTARAPEEPTTDFILIATKDIPARERTRLLPHGLGVGLEDDLLQRLWQLEKENRHLKSLSITDELTSLFNKRFFNRQLNIEIARTKRTGEPFCLVFIDLDNFKMVNDTLGHNKGDELLVRVCRQISTKIRTTDFACRFGGDEFAVILPATTLRDGILIAGRWHKLIVQITNEMQMPVSSSMGVDQFDAASKQNAQEFLHSVDLLLYKAKNTGKGKIAHPEIEIPDSKAVTWAEKEILYHIFQPSGQKQSSPQKSRAKK